MQETCQDAAENDAAIDYTYNPNYQSVAVNMYERNEDLGTNGESVNVLSATADKIPSICTNGAAYVGKNIITNGEYVAVVNPTNTEQKTLIKNNGIETTKVTYSDPLQSDALNRGVATDVIVADIVLSCDNGDIAVKRQKFVFHRVTEFIVLIMTNETRTTVSVPNDILARNSTTCNGRINITPVVSTSMHSHKRLT